MAAIDSPPQDAAPANDQEKTASAPAKRKQKTSTTVTDHTFRNRQWAYLHLSLHRSPPFSSSEVPLDAITARTHLTSALQQFLGLTGTAIAVDILKLESHDVWLRVPNEDANAVVAAVGGWVGDAGGDDRTSTSLAWRVKGRDEWLSRLAGGDGMDLFDG